MFVFVWFSASSPPSSPSPKQQFPVESTEPTTPSSQPDRSTSISLDESSPATGSPIDNEPSYQNANAIPKSNAESVNETQVQSTHNDVENSTNANVEVKIVAESLNTLSNDDNSKIANESINNANIINSNDTPPTVPTKHNNNKVEELYDIPVGK